MDDLPTDGRAQFLRFAEQGSNQPSHYPPATNQKDERQVDTEPTESASSATNSQTRLKKARRTRISARGKLVGASIEGDLKA